MLLQPYTLLVYRSSQHSGTHVNAAHVKRFQLANTRMAFFDALSCSRLRIRRLSFVWTVAPCGRTVTTTCAPVVLSRTTTAVAHIPCCTLSVLKPRCRHLSFACFVITYSSACSGHTSGKSSSIFTFRINRDTPSFYIENSRV